MKKDRVKEITFNPQPDGGYRFITEDDKNLIIDTKTGKTLKDDKLEYPSEFKNSFCITVETNNISFEFEIEANYRWNNADIYGIIQVIARCAKDDRKIILPSGIHDYMLEYKNDIYNIILEKYENYTGEEYRWLTSEIFRYLCITQGFSKIKATLMANIVDCFQKYFQKKKWKTLIKKSSLSL